MEEQNELAEAEAGDAQTADVGCEDMKTDKEMGDDDLMSDNKMQENISEMETSENVSMIVADILNDVIACCLSKVEQCQDNNENSLPAVIHPEANSQFTLESTEI